MRSRVDEAGWARIRAADRLDDLEPERVAEVAKGLVELQFGLPMPAISLVELVPKA